MRRRDLLGGLAGIAAMGSPAWARDYPSRHVRWVVPFAAGGFNDVIARKLAASAAPLMGQPIVIDNKPGVSGALGTRELIRAAPDGYNFAIAIPDSVIGVTALVKSADYDVRKDLTPVAQIAEALAVVVVQRELGVDSMAELVRLARAKPGSIAYGSGGQGSTPHLVMGSIERITRSRFTAVAYRGLAPAMQDFVAKQIQLVVIPATWIAQFNIQNSATAIAIVGSERSAFLPTVATLAEQGLAGPMLQASPWIGLVGPKGLPRAIVERWEAVLAQVIQSPDFVTFLGTVGFTPRLKRSEQFAADLATEYLATTQLVRDLGIVPE
jgi:tripartite-type tricarboxylate transporter receptor subunit TctC